MFPPQTTPFRSNRDQNGHRLLAFDGEQVTFRREGLRPWQPAARDDPTNRGVPAAVHPAPAATRLRPHSLLRLPSQPLAGAVAAIVSRTVGDRCLAALTQRKHDPDFGDLVLPALRLRDADPRAAESDRSLRDGDSSTAREPSAPTARRRLLWHTRVVVCRGIMVPVQRMRCWCISPVGFGCGSARLCGGSGKLRVAARRRCWNWGCVYGWQAIPPAAAKAPGT